MSKGLFPTIGTATRAVYAQVNVVSEALRLTVELEKRGLYELDKCVSSLNDNLSDEDKKAYEKYAKDHF